MKGSTTATICLMILFGFTLFRLYKSEERLENYQQLKQRIDEQKIRDSYLEGFSRGAFLDGIYWEQPTTPRLVDSLFSSDTIWLENYLKNPDGRFGSVKHISL